MPDRPFALPDRLTPAQQRVVSYPREGGGSLLLHGLPGAGKSTALAARLAALLREGRRPHEVLVLVSQRAQAERYEGVLATLDGPTRGGVDIVTFYGLSQRAVALFWPLFAREAGFGRPDREPTFLTLETAQYFMWRIVAPLIRTEGYFGDLAIRRGRLLSQLIDNLNKSALVGFDHTDIYHRLRGAWTGSPDHVSSYWQAQDCATRFREYCLTQNLLDFSLVTEVYHRYLFVHEVYRRYFRARYRHLIVDNLEENVPVAHEVIDWARRQCQSTAFAYDEGGGYRVFLGADAAGARELGRRCYESLAFTELLRPAVHTLAFSDALIAALHVSSPPASPQGLPRLALLDGGAQGDRYWIGMIRQVVDRLAALVKEGTPPGEIAIIAPYVSEVMRFAVEESLARRGIPLRLLRPSAPLRDSPVIRGLLSLALLAHPAWHITIQDEEYSLSEQDVALALQMTLAGLDPVRARYLARAALPPRSPALRDLSGAAGDGLTGRDLGRLWERVGHQVRQRYETLRTWLETYRQGQLEPLDIFLTRLFGDLLCQPGYGFFDQGEEARAYGRLVESAAKFRLAVGLDKALAEEEVAREYVQIILSGIATAEYLLDWPRATDDEAVILAPAYAYLTRDVHSSYQFWIDLGSDGWWNRPNQPLTHPYVLSSRWPVGQPWRDIEEEEARRQTLARVVRGLAARCTEGLYLAFSELGLDGVEQSGHLQRVLMNVLARMGQHG